MMYLGEPPRVIGTRLFSRLPEAFRRTGERSEWGQANRGAAIDCFLEGPAFDDDGTLLVVDIPFGRIFGVSPAGEWSLVASYDGWPNGLKRHPDGRFIIADYRRGLLVLDRKSGVVTPLVGHRNSESFRGCNDLHIARNGDIYFTEQGQTGLHDPTGKVWRLAPDGRLDCLLATGPSPNGLVLDRDERVLFVAMTRDNAVWRVPLMRDGGVAKVGRFCSMFGPGGPDGMTMDARGRLLVAHVSLGAVLVFAPTGACVAVIRSAAGTACTNVALGGDTGTTLYVTESETGSILVANLDVLDA